LADIGFGKLLTLIVVAGLAVARWVDATTGEITFGEAMAAGGLALWAATWT
jgi:hypothetical protein